MNPAQLVPPAVTLAIVAGATAGLARTEFGKKYGALLGTALSLLLPPVIEVVFRTIKDRAPDLFDKLMATFKGIGKDETLEALKDITPEAGK